MVVGDPQSKIPTNSIVATDLVIAATVGITTITVHAARTETTIPTLPITTLVETVVVHRITETTMPTIKVVASTSILRPRNTTPILTTAMVEGCPHLLLRHHRGNPLVCRLHRPPSTSRCNHLHSSNRGTGHSHHHHSSSRLLRNNTGRSHHHNSSSLRPPMANPLRNNSRMERSHQTIRIMVLHHKPLLLLLLRSSSNRIHTPVPQLLLYSRTCSDPELRLRHRKLAIRSSNSAGRNHHKAQHRALWIF
mmetsp:Transcript_1944/g.4558  ORF Transcript_1944/g.4558 Transcript_1944/m.4558 type:complete len:250 (-) Transcript_1944:35-784(-)